MLVTMTTHLGKTWENHFAKAEIFFYIYRDLQCNFHHDKSQHVMRVKLTKVTCLAVGHSIAADNSQPRVRRRSASPYDATGSHVDQQEEIY